MLERFVSKQHKAGALFYLHSTMLRDQDLVLKQFADMLNLRRLVDSEQEYVDLIENIKTRLPEALEILEAAESAGANVTTSGRVRRRWGRRRRLKAAGSGGEGNDQSLVDFCTSSFATSTKLRRDKPSSTGSS